MAASLTGLLLIAGVGLLKNKGLGVNNKLILQIGRFNNTGISGVIQGLLSNTNLDPRIIVQISRLPTFMTGLCPPGVTIGGSSTITNVPQAILNQGKSLFARPPGMSLMSLNDEEENYVSTFTSVYSAASGYAAQTFSFQGSLASIQGMKFDDLGFQFSNYEDVISGGVTNQFNAEGLPALSKQLSSLGTMFDTNDLSKISDPIALVNNLINQGLGSVGNLQDMINEQSIDLTDPYPTDTDKDLVRNILAEISGSDLEEIMTVTEFEPVNKRNIKTLADVLDINNLFDTEALSALGDNPTLDTFTNKMSNLGGKFGSTASIGNFFSSLDLTPFPTLSKLDTLLPDGFTADLPNVLGKGTGIFGNPTVDDMTSSASGSGYIEYLTSMNDAQDHLLEYDEDVAALNNYLDTNPNPDPDMLQQLVDNVLDKPELLTTFVANEELMRKSADKLDTEKLNLSVAGIVPGAKISNSSGLMNFSSSLHGFGVDPMNLGLGKQIIGLAQSGLEGEALAASIIEGKNLGRLSVFGINPGTKMDPMAYARALAKIA